MNWKKMLHPTPGKILLAVILPYVLFVVAFELSIKPDVVVVHLLGQPVFSDNIRIDTFIKSLIFASVYSIPNWIWSYPLSAYALWKSGRKKK